MISRAQKAWAFLGAAMLCIAAIAVFFVMRSPTTYVLATVGIATIFTIIFAFYSVTGAKVQTYLNDDHPRVTGGMLDVRVPYDRIDKVELRSDVKWGSRLAGYAGIDLIGGFFGNKEFGIYRVGAYLSTPGCIVVSYDQRRTLVFNLDSLAKTEQVYRDLVQKKGSIAF